jgi:hypothetical protein
MLTLAVLLSLASDPRPVEVTSPRGYSLTLPDGFVEYPAGDSGDIVHTHVKGTAPDHVVVAIQELKGRIPKGARCLDPKDPKAPPGATAGTVPWKTHQLCWMQLPQQGFIARFVEVPLKKGAINLQLVVAEKNVKQLDPLTAKLVASLKGESNWD